MEEVRAAGARNHHRRRNFPKTRKETEVEGGGVSGGGAIDRNKISEERSRPLQRGVKLSTGSPCLCASWQNPDCEREGCWRSQTCRRARFPFTDLHDFFFYLFHLYPFQCLPSSVTSPRPPPPPSSLLISPTLNVLMCVQQQKT